MNKPRWADAFKTIVAFNRLMLALKEDKELYEKVMQLIWKRNADFVFTEANHITNKQAKKEYPFIPNIRGYL